MTAREMEQQLLRLSERYEREPDAEKRKALNAEYRALHRQWMRAKAKAAA